MSPKPIKKRKKAIRIQEYFQWVFPMIVSVVIAFLLVQIVGNTIIVKGNSMAPVCEKGDIVFVNKLSYRFGNPERYDIVVFDINAQNTEDMDGEPRYTMSRIVGMPGETIQIIDGVLYIDGKKWKSGYIKDEILNPGVVMEPITLQQNRYFVMGDNCNYSEDSRFSNIGNIKKDAMLGKVMQ